MVYSTEEKNADTGVKIIQIISDTALPRKEIRIQLKNQGVDVTEEAIKKNLLKMVTLRQIGFFEKGEHIKGTATILKDAFRRKWGEKKHFYYFATPKSAALFQELTQYSIMLPKDRQKRYLDSILMYFQNVEVMAKFQKSHGSDSELIRKAHLEKGIKLTQEQIEEKKKRFAHSVEKVAGLNQQFKFTLSLFQRKIIDNKEYTLIGRKWVEIALLEEFINRIRKHMDDYMVWGFLLNRENEPSKSIMEGMAKLFVEVELAR